MKKNFLNFWLLAALLCGMSLGVTSCKDDDNNDNNSNNGSEGQETFEGLLTLEDDQLADLISVWTDTSRDNLSGNAWRNSTYEPTVGLALDESDPGIRYVAVGTTEEADRYAASALGTLGIDYKSPAGFKYSNNQVGTVAYSHSEGNTLGTISVDIRQIPVLREIRLVKVLPDNAQGEPYYKCGDIVKYKDRFYVCVSDHRYGQEARFITLNDQDSHIKGKFTWLGVGKDSVYSDDMAKAEVLGDWLEHVVCNYDMWNKVRNRMISTNNEQYTNQVIPENEVIRTSLVNHLISDNEYIPELQELNRLPADGVSRYQALNFTWEEDEEAEKATLAPVGFLLADKLRYTMINNYDKWVPYIFLVRGEERYTRVHDLEYETPSQYKDPSHFLFKTLNKFRITDDDQLIGTKTFLEMDGNPSYYNEIKKDYYYVCVIGMHWTHKRFNTDITNYKTLFNFLTDWKRHPMKVAQEPALRHPENWIFRNITSRSLTFTDKGEKNKNYDDVSIQ
ncbi:MAG: hypothetical protein IKZ48_04485 [Prevotella sp.]|nr:hypothetical protein [Prevotella sp.]